MHKITKSDFINFAKLNPTRSAIAEHFSISTRTVDRYLVLFEIKLPENRGRRRLIG
jgi:hypothetical protein